MLSLSARVTWIYRARPGFECHLTLCIEKTPRTYLEACLFVSVFDDGFPRLIEEEDGHGHYENKFNVMLHVGIAEPKKFV